LRRGKEEIIENRGLHIRKGAINAHRNSIRASGAVQSGGKDLGDKFEGDARNGPSILGVVKKIVGNGALHGVRARPHRLPKRLEVGSNKLRVMCGPALEVQMIENFVSGGRVALAVLRKFGLRRAMASTRGLE
jgi:hypothetical protein